MDTRLRDREIYKLADHADAEQIRQSGETEYSAERDYRCGVRVGWRNGSRLR